MPRYEYRDLHPVPAAEEAFLDWIQKLDEQFSNNDVEHRSIVVRNTLHELYLGQPYAEPSPNTPFAERALVHNFDPATPLWSLNTTATWTRRNTPSANL